MSRTNEPAGWTSQFRKIVLNVYGRLQDLRGSDPAYAAVLDPVAYGPAQALGEQLKAVDSEGFVYPSVRNPGGECTGLFFPILASNPTQDRHLDYHWNSTHVDYFREPATGKVVQIT